MADKEKAKEASQDESVTFLNRGQRSYDLGNDAAGKPRYHRPGTTMAYTAAEAARHEGYSDLIDISKMPGTESARKVKDDRDALAAENTALKAQLAALNPSTEKEPVPEASAKSEKAEAPAKKAK